MARRNIDLIFLNSFILCYIRIDRNVVIKKENIYGDPDVLATKYEADTKLQQFVRAKISKIFAV